MSFSNLRVSSEGNTLDQKFSPLPKLILRCERGEEIEQNKWGALRSGLLHADFGALITEQLEHFDRVGKLRGATLNAVIDVRGAIST